MEWADATVWTAVLGASQAREDERIKSTFHHVHLVQQIFVQAWLGGPIAVPQVSDFMTIEHLAQWGREGHRQIAAFLRQTPEPILDRSFREPWTNQFEARLAQPAAAHTLGESIVQVVMHTAHHRGQLCTRLRELIVEPPTVDYIVWLWAGRPDAGWMAMTVDEQ